ncbi:MAG: phosphotransferase [Candidatus Xenobia bacterium]
MPQWTPEFRADEAQAAALIDAQFPALSPPQLSLLGEGWDNVAWLVNDRVVFRFPRRQIAVRLIERETRVLSRLPVLPLAVPRPEYVGRPTDDYPYPWAGYERLPGHTACQRHPTDAERLAMAPRLGAFLRGLHTAPTEGMDLPGEELGRLQSDRRRPRLLELLDRLKAAGLLQDPASFQDVVDCAESAPHRRCLVHGDLYARHLLVDDAARLCGVIDWGDLHRGDPAVDLSLVHSFLPPEAHPAFLDAYGLDVPSDTWRLARWRGLWHSCLIADYSLSTGDRDLLQEALTSIRYISLRKSDT